MKVASRWYRGNPHFFQHHRHQMFGPKNYLKTWIADICEFLGSRVRWEISTVLLKMSCF